MLNPFKKHKDKIAQIGGIEEKKASIQKTIETADRINELCNKLDIRFHDVPVELDRRNPA